MSGPPPRCILLLSSKSSGSSACQDLLARIPGVRHVRRTRHHQHETLYWTKAASVLGMDQQPLLDSEVPIAREAARRDLLDLLRDNLRGAADLPRDDRALVFEGWRRLCHEYAPVFLEKSPHHLPQKACLDLILQARRELPGIDFLLVGLVRNPLDQLYSAWRRWQTSPEAGQFEWLRAYGNLLELKDRAGDRLVVLRYEDLVRDPGQLRPVLDFIEPGCPLPEGDLLHGRSVGRWRSDPGFGFQLAPEVRHLAKQLGYRDEELSNPGVPLAAARRAGRAALRILRRGLGPAARPARHDR